MEFSQPQLQQLRQGVLVIPDHPGHKAPLRPEGHWHPPGFLLTLLPTPRAAPLTYSAGQGSRPTHLRRQNRHQDRNVLGPWNGAEVRPAAQDHPATPLLLILSSSPHPPSGHSPNLGVYVLNAHNGSPLFRLIIFFMCQLIFLCLFILLKVNIMIIFGI